MPASSSSSSASSSSISYSFHPPPRLRLFHLHFRLAPPPLPPCSTSTSTLPTLPTRRQALRQLPSSVRIAGRQLTSCPAQWCVPLDLNLRAAQPKVHRWTSIWDLSSSVNTTVPQRPDKMPENIPNRIPENIPNKIPWDVITYNK